jgi:hypothetical protein
MAIKILNFTDMKFVNYHPKIEIPDLRRPEYQHLFRNPIYKGMADIAKAYAIEDAYVQYTEQAILAGMFGNAVGGVRTTIGANTATTTSIATGLLASSGTSGNMDQTPTSTAVVYNGHPAASPNFNQFSVVQSFLLTAAAATSVTFASITTGYAVTHTATINLTDVLFVAGSGTAGGLAGGVPMPMLSMYQNTYIGLSTQAFAGSTQVNLLSNEPTAGTGSYARIGYPTGGSTPTTLWNTQLNWPSPSAASPSVLTTANGPWSFAQSTAGWSSGATNLSTMFIADAYSIGSGNSNILAAGALTTPQAVAAANITLSFANAAITLTLT